MAVLLRDPGAVPTRIAEGFLPGALDPSTGIETIQLISGPTPGSRSTSRAMAGSCSTRPAATGPRFEPLPVEVSAASDRGLHQSSLNRGAPGLVGPGSGDLPWGPVNGKRGERREKMEVVSEMFLDALETQFVDSPRRRSSTELGR